MEKKLAEAPTVHPSAMVVRSRIGRWTEIGPGWSILGSNVGDYSYMAGCDGVIHYCDIGNFCSIASHVVVNPGDHPTWKVTQHHMTYRRNQYGFGEDDDDFFRWRRSKSCSIGHDVWIGHGAMIMAGVTVGPGSVIGAGSVVTRDIEPYTVSVGVPACPLRKRFSENAVRELLRIQWWNWDHETIRERLSDLNDLEFFLEKYR